MTQNIVYTCGSGESGPTLVHPCSKATSALREAGHDFELRKLGGLRLVPGSRAGKRDAVEALTGKPDVPVLVLADGTVIGGSKNIVAWAKANPA